MTTPLVLTAIGPDKPGLVDLLSQTLSSHGANWLESSLSRLAGQFAGVVVAEADPARVEELKQALEALTSEGLTVTVTESAPTPAPANTRALILELTGHDQPGIVREISHALAERNINVEKFRTELVSGSMSAEQLFKAYIALQVPRSVDLDELQQRLEAIANDLMVDISLAEGD